MSLRGAGWRFLLPADVLGPRARFVVSGDPAAANSLVELGFAGTVVGDDELGESGADCAARLVGGAATIDGLAAAVRSGGVVVVQVDRRERGWRRTTPDRLARRARRAGLRVDATYLAAPTAQVPRRFVPLDDDAALGWYWRCAFVTAGPLLWASMVAARGLLALRAARLVRALAPAYVVICRAGGPSARIPAAVAAAGMVDEVTSVAVVSSDQDRASRAVVLAFDGGRDPVAVFKMASHPAHNARTRAENRRLDEVRAIAPARVAASVPRALGRGEVCGGAVIAQSAFGGPTLEGTGRSLGRRGRAERGLHAAVAWLADLQSATSTRTRRWGAAASDAAVLTPLHGLLERHGADIDGPAVVAYATAVCGAAQTTDVPVVVEHFDLAPVNVVLGRGGVGVVDWEVDDERLAAPGAGLPGRDLWFLVTMWTFAVRGTTELDDECRALAHLVGHAGDRHGGEAGRALEHYRNALGIERAVLDLALVSLWVDRAGHHERRWAETGSDPTASPPEVTRSLRYLEALSTVHA